MRHLQISDATQNVTRPVLADVAVLVLTGATITARDSRFLLNTRYRLGASES